MTWSLVRGPQAMSPAERDLVAGAFQCFEGARYVLTAWVVMNDHAHVIVRPAPLWPLSGILHSWKSFTAHKFVKEYDRAAPVR